MDISRALDRALAWQIYKRLTGRYGDLTVFNGLRLQLYPDCTSAREAQRARHCTSEAR